MEKEELMNWRCTELIFPQQQNAKGSLHNIDFGVFWAGKELGSGNQFREPATRLDGSNRFFGSKVPGSVFGKPGSGPEELPRFSGSEGCVREVSKVSVFDELRQVRFCSRGLDGTVSGNRVPGTRGIEKVPGSGDSVAKVPKVELYFESMLLHFETIFFFESALWYFERYSILLYFERILLYFATMLASSCTENQYSKGKEKVEMNVHFINANLLAVGDTNYAYFPTAECYGVFAQYRFRCVLGELGRFREGTGFQEPVPGTGSGNQFWEPDPGFDRFRQVLRFQGSGSEGCVKEVSKVSVFDGFRGVRFCSRVLTEPCLGTGFQEPEVLRRLRAKVSDSYSVLRKYTLVLRKCTFAL